MSYDKIDERNFWAGPPTMRLGWYLRVLGLKVDRLS